MKIKRINKIKNHRIFIEFDWTEEDLCDFNKKNLFYGWNGTGKSILSNLFRAIEKKTDISEGEIEFVISGEKIIDRKALAKGQGLPQVRVFNKDFIAENVFTSDDSVTPIFFLGKENIEKQKQVEKLKGDIADVEKERSEKDKAKKQLEKDFEDFKKDRGKSIKDLLSSSGGNNSYNYYDKSKYQNKCEELIKLSVAEQDAKDLSKSDFDEQKKKKESKQLDKIDVLNFKYPDTQELTVQVEALLKKTVVPSVIEALKNDPELSKWMKMGLEIHKKDDSNDCLFCKQPMPDSRIQELEAHFNDQYNEFITEIETLSNHIQSEIKSLELPSLPHPLAFYEHLQDQASTLCQELRNKINNLKKDLKSLLEALEDKEYKLFQVIKKSFNFDTDNRNVISNLNEVIIKHNQETDDFKEVIREARIAIEESQVAKSLKKYKEQKCEINKLDKYIHSLTEKVTTLDTQAREIEKDIQDHQSPAEELNSDIHDYLGRDELTFEIHGLGYQIRRNGTLAKDISEGEKTAISFLYFLKSLEDKSFSLKEGIVVIDDPVSSLDYNSLFTACGFMKDRTEDAGQLFIFTHNYSFFREVKNWFNFLAKYDKDEVGFYMLRSKENGGVRSSYISKLDNLLREYESEYHYLFSLVYKAACSAEKDLEENYPLPNIARRLLEAFLAFSQPSKRRNLRKKLNLIDFDKEKKSKILRFLNIYSHAEHIFEPEHDLSNPDETKKVLQDLLDLIKEENKNHFNEMEKVVKGTDK